MSDPSPSRNALKRRFKDILGLSISAGLAQIAAVVALPLLQRYCYGPVAFADMAAYAQLAGILGAVATLRMDLALVKQNSLENARATLSNGLRALVVTAFVALVLVLGLQNFGFEMGSIPWLWCLLPLGVVGVGLNGLVTGWLSREERFHKLAVVRAGGGVAGEALRFASVPLGSLGLIVGRIAGQWCSAIWGLRALQNSWRSAPQSTRSSRKTAWKNSRAYAIFTTPANVLAMAANGLFILYLFEHGSSTIVGAAGAGMAYLTVAAGLVIRSVSDVFFKHLDDVPPETLLRHYTGWVAALILISSLGVSVLWAIPDPWVTQLLGDAWKDMLPIMRILAPWMVPWIAGSALSGIFPHLGKQSWTLVLDALHLAMVSGLIWTFEVSRTQDVLSDATALLLIGDYTVVQASFYTAAIGVAMLAIALRKNR